MAYTGNFGGPRFTAKDVWTLEATNRSLYISDNVVDAAAFLYGREAMMRNLPVVVLRATSLFRYDRPIDKVLERVAATVGPKRRPNAGHSTVAAILHRVEHILIPIFDSDLDHWSIAHIRPLERTVHILDSMRTRRGESTHRLAPGAARLEPPAQIFYWNGRTPPLLCILQNIECMRALELCQGDAAEALDTLLDPGHKWPKWKVVEGHHASPQVGNDCGIMTLLYIRAVCKGTITDPDASSIEGGIHAHRERLTVHDHLLSWNQRGLERVDTKYVHHTPVMILEGIVMRHLISDEEKCGDPVAIVAIVKCSQDIEDCIVEWLYYILWLAGIPKKCLAVHRARNLLPDSPAWSQATIYIHLYTSARKADTKWKASLQEAVRKLVVHAQRTDDETGRTEILPLTIVAGYLCPSLDRAALFPNTCYQNHDGSIEAPSDRKYCSNWYITATSSYKDTVWSSRRGYQCDKFVGRPSGLYLPRARDYPEILIVEHKYMSLGLAHDAH